MSTSSRASALAAAQRGRSPRSTIARWLVHLVVCLSCVAAVGCASEKKKHLDVAIDPASARIPIGGSYTLSLHLRVSPEVSSGTAEWWIDGAGIGNSAVGYLLDYGDALTVGYQPPAAVPVPDNITVRVRVTSPGYSDASASCSIQIVPPVNITVTPQSASVRVGETVQFTAEVIGAPEQGVEWSVGYGDASQGTIDASGLYTAPPMRPYAPATIRATSTAFPMVSATAEVAIAIKLTVDPAEATVPFGVSQQLVATVEGTPNTGVTWLAQLGSVTSDGLYVAPDDARSDDLVLVRANDDWNTVVEVPIHLTPPPAVLADLPAPLAPGDTLVVLGSGFVGIPELHMPMAGGTTLSLTPELVSSTELRVTVPAGCASGPLSVTMKHGAIAPTTSNAVAFTRLPRLRVHAPQRDLAAGESVALEVAFLGADPVPLSWSADLGDVDAGTFVAPTSLAADDFARVTACVSGTAVCDTVVLGLHPFRIEPAAGLVRPGETIELSAVASTGPIPASWQVVSGSGSFGTGGSYTASGVFEDAGRVVVAATREGVTEEAALGVRGAFPGLLARSSDYADSRTSPAVGKQAGSLAVLEGHAYAFASSLLFENPAYGWIDAYDVSEPTSPRWLGAVENPIALRTQPLAAGGHLYAIGTDAAGRACVAIYDLASGVPRLLAQYAIEAWVAIALDGDLLYAAESLGSGAQSRVLGVYDTRTGSLSTVRRISVPVVEGDDIYWMAVSGSRLYASPMDGTKLFVFDISGAEATWLATVEDGTWWANLRIASGLLFAGGPAALGDDYATRVYDIAADVPVAVSSIFPPVLVAGARGSLLLGATMQSGMRIVDISDPAQPRLVTHVFGSVNPESVPAWSGDVVITLEGAGGLAVYDVLQPGGPLEMAAVGQPGETVNGFLVRGDSMFEAVRETYAWSHLVRIYDVGQGRPVETGRVSTSFVGAMEAGGGYLYASSENGLEVWDVAVPSAPVPVATLPIPARTLCLADGVLYVESRSDLVGLREIVVLDVRVPATPVQLASVPFDFYPRNLAAAGSALVVAAGPELVVYDVSNPAAITLAARLDLGTEVNHVAASGTTGYVATANGLAILDFSDPAAPVLRSQTCPPGWYPFESGGPTCPVYRVAWTPDLLWTFGSEAAGWDVHDPTRPRLVSTAMLPFGLSSEVGVRWPWLYLATVGQGYVGAVHPVDVSQPRNVVHLLYQPEALGRPY